mgnify:CR=1 FL=1
MKKLTALWLSLLLAFRHTDRLCRSNRHYWRGGRTDRHHHLGQRFRCFRHRRWAVRQQERGCRLSDRIRALTLQLHHEKSRRRHSAGRAARSSRMHPAARSAATGSATTKAPCRTAAITNATSTPAEPTSAARKRLVYADDGRIYYTADHYETFEEITE